MILTYAGSDDADWKIWMVVPHQRFSQPLRIGVGVRVGTQNGGSQRAHLCVGEPPGRTHHLVWIRRWIVHLQVVCGPVIC